MSATAEFPEIPGLPPDPFQGIDGMQDVEGMRYETQVPRDELRELAEAGKVTDLLRKFEDNLYVGSFVVMHSMERNYGHWFSGELTLPSLEVATMTLQARYKNMDIPVRERVVACLQRGTVFGWLIGTVRHTPGGLNVVQAENPLSLPPTGPRPLVNA